MEEKTVNNKTRYFTDFFKKCYYLPALFFMACALTVMVLYYETGFGGMQYSSKNKFYFFIISGVWFTLLTIVYLIMNIKKNKIVLADSIIFAMPVFSIAFIFYVAFSLKAFSVLRICLPVIVFVIGGIFIIFRAINYVKSKEQEPIYYTGSKFYGYYSTFFRTYSFLTVIIVGLIGASVFFLFYNNTFRNYLTEAVNTYPVFKYIVGVSLILTLLYFVVTASNKKLHFLDVIIFSSALSIPVGILELFYGLKEGIHHPLFTENLIIICAVSVLMILLYFIRLKSFDCSVPKQQQEKQGCYTLSVCRKYNIFAILSSASVITSVTAVIFATHAYERLFKYVDGKLDVAPQIIFVSFIAVVIASCFIAGLVVAYLKCTSKKIGYGDFALWGVTFTTLFSYSLIPIISFVYYPVILGALTIFCIGAIYAKIRNYYFVEE